MLNVGIFLSNMYASKWQIYLYEKWLCYWLNKDTVDRFVYSTTLFLTVKFECNNKQNFRWLSNLTDKILT